ncbi:MAG: 2-C-methyl-D-erythritol 4-phosphate cytidylyltransferase, partial [Desulfuromonadales bacterium]|nr:2-C-methyl-D-erythritol 4-phosphate cytidylyltransferase [Desulfuromonadales bacterium]
RIVATPERGRLWQAQTPQGFTLSLIREAHEAAFRDGFRGTDDASLVERLGRCVAMIQGSYRNIKITTPEDLVLAEAFLAGGER